MVMEKSSRFPDPAALLHRLAAGSLLTSSGRLLRVMNKT